MAVNGVPSPEPLLTFTESFNFKQFVQDQLSDNEPGAMATESARLIGQEKDGSVLFAWNRKNNAGGVITCVGLYQKSTPLYVTLYQHDTVTNIIAASVNHERTLLAFTTKSTDDEPIYDSFIAEIKPQSRVFTLNIAGTDFRKLQFLHPDSSSSKNPLTSRTQQRSHLLVIIPGVIICVYKFKMQIVRNGAVVIAQPDKEIVLKKNFSWYQWDPQMQYLYYARFESSTGRLQASVSGKNSLLLHCTRFVQCAPQLLFTVSLPLPYNDHHYSSSTTFYNSPFAFTHPVREMNLQVLYRRDGFWCVCLQHCTGSSTNHDIVGTDSPQGSKIDYSVYIFHNGYVLYGQVPLSVPTNEKIFIYFMLIGCFVVAYIPGFMLHLLNVGPRVDPCHHLTFGPEHSMFLPKQPTGPKEGKSEEAPESEDVILTSAMSSSLLGDYNISLMDSNSGTTYECALNTPGFFTIFKECMDPEMMEDILHLVIVGFRHPGMALSMIEYICQTPMRFSDHKLFAEFIIASSFANVYLDCKQFIARQLPLTTSPTFHGKVYKNQDGVKLAYIKLSPMQNFVKQLLVQSDQKLVVASPEDLLNHVPSSDQAFETLCFNAVINQSKYPRIDLRAMIHPPEDKGISSQGQATSSSSSRDKKRRSYTPASSSSSPYGILGRISSTLNRRTTSNQPFSVHNGKDPQEMLWFLDSDEDLLDDVTADGSKMRENMINVIGKDLPLRAKNVIYNTNARYYAELQKQSCNLLLTIWTSLGFSIDNHPLNLAVCRSPTPKEQILQELLEAYLLAHLDIGIHPPSGFHTLYNSMAFLCLERSLFLQYIRNKVLVPTRRFIDMLLEDCEEEEDAQVVFHIFNSLDYRLAEYALERWHDPTIRTLVAPSIAGDKSRRL